MMEADGAELMKDWRRQRTVEGRFGWNKCRMERLLKEANGIGMLLVWLWWCGMEDLLFSTGRRISEGE
jgi:hypothetical protein